MVTVTANDVEAAIKTNANRVFEFCTHWEPEPYYFFPLNNYHKYTTHGVCYFNGEGSWKFLKD